MSIGENFFLFFKVKFYFFKQQLKTFFKFYRKPTFALCDLCFILSYLFRNPYVISRRFLQKQKRKDIYTYGETPYCTMEKMVRFFEIEEKDTFIELGSGRGKTLFWLSYFVRCKIIGVEWIETFVKRAVFLTKFFGKNKIRFIHEDMYQTHLENNSFIYLYGTCMSNREIKKMIEKFNSYSNLKIITISFALGDYCSNYFIEKEIAVSFPWGKTTAYLNRRKNETSF